MTEEQQNDYFEIIKRFAYEDEYDDTMDFEGQLENNKAQKKPKNQNWNTVNYKDGKKANDTDTSEASDMEEPEPQPEPQKRGEPRRPNENYSTQRDDRRGGGRGGRGGRGRGAQQNNREYNQKQRNQARAEPTGGDYETKEENMYARAQQNEGGALDRDGGYTKKTTNRGRGGGGGGRGRGKKN